MKRAIAMTSSLALIAAVLLSPMPADAGEKRSRAAAPAAPAAPRSEEFADGGHSLKLIGLPDSDGEGMALTLIYEDGQSARSITIDPVEARGRDAAALRRFLQDLDEAFLSFVRASLADRILHLSTSPSEFDRAQLELFFPGHHARLAGAANVERVGSEPSSE